MVYLVFQTVAAADDPYVTGIVEDITPELHSWPDKLKLFSVYDKAGEMIIDPRGHYTLYSKWIITENGKRFPGLEIDRALKEINYVPGGETEAKQITAIIAQLKFNARTIDNDMIEDNLITKTIPADIIKLTCPTVVKKTKKGFTLRFFCYIKADSGFPQEWIDECEAIIQPGIYEIKKIKTVWTEKGRYRW